MSAVSLLMNGSGNYPDSCNTVRRLNKDKRFREESKLEGSTKRTELSNEIESIDLK